MKKAILCGTKSLDVSRLSLQSLSPRRSLSPAASHDYRSPSPHSRRARTPEDVSSEEQEETYTCRILLGDDFPVYNGHRTHLPAQMRDRNPINVLQILKDCIGKDVTRITMPITLNEPLTLIQRFAENLEYVDLVSKAACLGNSLDRLEYLSAFVVSGFSGIIERVNKPFNPILGETFEMTHPVQQVRFVAEQVSHHPPISAFYIEDISENKSFKLTCSCQPKIKFLGKTVNIYVRNALELVLPHLNEKYTWGAVDCIIDNLYVGRPRIEYDGSFTIKNTNTNEFAKVQVFPTSIFNTKRPHEIEGYIYGADKTKQRYLFGFCNLEMFSVPYDETLQKEQKKLSKQLETPFSQNGTLQKRQTKALSESSQSGGLHGEESLDREKSEKNENGSDDNKDSEEPLSVKVEENYEMWKSNNSSSPSFSPKLLWKVNARPFWCQDEYNFTSFSMTLNEITGDISQQIADGELPKTDSRMRPDVRLMENGELTAAAEEKMRLEDKQRTSEKFRVKTKEEWKPLWFDFDEEEKKWVFNGKYWDREYENCPDIF